MCPRRGGGGGKGEGLCEGRFGEESKGGRRRLKLGDGGIRCGVELLKVLDGVGVGVTAQRRVRGEWAEEGLKEGRRWGDVGVGEEEAEGREARSEDTKAKFDKGPEEKFGNGDCEKKAGGQFKMEIRF